MYKYLLIFIHLAVIAQSTPTTYPYPKPLPATGSISDTTVKLSSVVNPTAYNDTRPAVWDVFLGGSYRSVGTISERNSINASVRKQGMLVYSADTSHIYVLGSNLTSWTDLGNPTSWGTGGTSTPVVDNVTILSITTGTLCITKGYYTPGDNGGGTYWFDSGSVDTANGGTVITGIGGKWKLLHNGTVSLLQFGVVQDNIESSGLGNIVRFQAAVNAMAAGGTLYLPKSPNLTWFGPGGIKAAGNISNLTIQLDGDIKRAGATTWPVGFEYSFLQLTDYAFNNLNIQGSATIDGNSLNQPTSVTYNYGKENCIRLDHGTNCSIKDLHIKNFGSMGIINFSSSSLLISGVTVANTNGNNDHYPLTTRWGANSDGIHIYDSKNVIIQKCIVSSTDDSIAVTCDNNMYATNVLISDCILMPYAGSSYQNHGVRIGMNQGSLTGLVSNVKVQNCLIDCHGGAGIVIGCNDADTRKVSGVTLENVTVNNANGIIEIGPNAGTYCTRNLNGGLSVLCVNDCRVSNLHIKNSQHVGISIANVGTFMMNNSDIFGVLEGGSSYPHGAGLVFWQDLYGPVDFCQINNFTVSGAFSDGIAASGSTYPIGVYILRDATAFNNPANISLPVTTINYVSGSITF